MRVVAIDGKRSDKHRSNPTSENVIRHDIDGVSTDVITAYWDSTLNAKFDKHCAINTSTPMTPSERACAASHASIWKLIVEMAGKQRRSSEQSNIIQLSPAVRSLALKLPAAQLNSLLPPANRAEQVALVSHFHSCSQWSEGADLSRCHFLIMEDDAEIKSSVVLDGETSGFLAKVSEIMRELPLDADICYLGYVKPYEVKFKRHKRFLKPTYLWQLHAYLLSARGAATLLSSLPINSPVDNFVATLIHENKLKVKSLLPHKSPSIIPFLVGVCCTS